jgi:YrbI family 3-deoxy-D-manno-octulosonate 8-phosphate phosphatase
MTTIAIIPARGGSKSIPGKNLRRVAGVSLVARAIAAALATASIDRVVVSTDDDSIAEAARVAGAEVVKRPAILSGDSATLESAVLHAIERSDATPGLIVVIQPTSPFIDPLDLESAIARVLGGECDVVFSGIDARSPLWRGTVEHVVALADDAGSAAADIEYKETGAFYVLRADGFLLAGSRFFGRVGVAVVDRGSALRVVGPEDLERARAIAPLLDRPTPIDVDALVTDFDGVHTDDRVSVGGDGSERVTASRADGVGIEMLRNAGYRLLILSRQTNRVVTALGRKLGVDVRQGLEDKATVLAAWARARNLDLSRVAYVGNDVNDLACMELVGWPIAVADAHPEVVAAARVILEHGGGHGAIREIAERILKAGSRELLAEDEPWHDASLKPWTSPSARASHPLSLSTKSDRPTTN